MPHGLYIQVYNSLLGHRKLLQLTRTLKCSHAEGIGRLVVFWCWVMENAMNGDLSTWSDEDLIFNIGRGFNQKTLDALRACGFIDEDNTVHDWYETGGKLAERREVDKERKRADRAKDKAGTVHTPSDGQSNGQSNGQSEGTGEENPRTVHRSEAATASASALELSEAPDFGKSIVGQKSPDGVFSETVAEIIQYLNEKTGSHYKPTTPKTQQLIKTRMKEGFFLGEFKTAIDNQVHEWSTKPEMQKFLRPETLFGTKFESYVNNFPKKNGSLPESFLRTVAAGQEFLRSHTDEDRSVHQGNGATVIDLRAGDEPADAGRLLPDSRPKADG